MNKKDCENIAYCLCEYRASKHLCESMFKLDSRIELEYQLWLEVQGKDDETIELFETEMEKQFGDNWAISSKVTKEASKEIYDNIKNRYDA